MKRQPIPQADVLAWLSEHHPELHAGCEIERDWLWLTVPSLKDKPEVRESIKEYGFIMHGAVRKGGGHALPGGKLGTWSHACMHPIGFHRKKGGGVSRKEEELTTEEAAMLLS